MWLRKIWYLNELRRNQWLKRSELEKIQRRRLRAIIKHAYDNVEFYHRKFKAVGITPDDIKVVEDLIKIPVTTKSEVRNGFRTRQIINRGLDLSKCHLGRTGGSTGEPLTVVYDKKAEDFQKAVAIRSYMGAGGRFRDKWAIVTSPQRMLTKRRWFQQLGFLSPVYISLFDPAERHIDVLRRLKPDVLEGYSSSLWLLARAMRKNGIDDIKPRSLITSAEVLSQKVRNFISSTFGVEIFDQFGCIEVGRSAWECEEHAGYHMDIDALVMEFVEDNEEVAPGESGRLLYTSLYNYAMPLIRYDIGDICIHTEELCSCGRGLPLIKHIEGRTDDFVTIPNGRIFSPIIWTIIMRPIPGIAQFRVIQETKNRFVVQIVKDYDFSANTVPQVEEGIKRVLGDVQVETEVVEEIPKDKAGKLRSVISKVKVD